MAPDAVTYMSLEIDRIKLALSMATGIENAGDVLAMLDRKSDLEILEWLQDTANRKIARAVMDAAGFQPFEIKELKCDDAFAWEMKLNISKALDKVYHRYRVYFCHNPKPFWDNIDSTERDIKELQQDVQLAMPGMENERDDRIDKFKKNIAHQNNQLIEQRNNCPEISFEGVVQKNDWKDGTTISISVPKSIVNRLNEQSGFISCYTLRLEKIGE